MSVESSLTAQPSNQVRQIQAFCAMHTLILHNAAAIDNVFRKKCAFKKYASI